MSIYQHFRKEEQPFIDQVLSWREHVERTFQMKLTDFLDPREQQIIEAIIGPSNDELQVQSYGGGRHSERKRVIIAPYYEDVTAASFNLTLLEGKYAEKFVSLSHPDVMGAFLSLGIERKKLGDIFVENGMIQIVVASEIAPYVSVNLTNVKNSSINLDSKDLSHLIERELEWIESDKTVSSLRLDAIVKAIYHLSRKEAADFIEKKLVKVNFKIVEDGKMNLESGDMISLRGRGRSKLLHINGRTKKNKLKITTALLK